MLRIIPFLVYSLLLVACQPTTPQATEDNTDSPTTTDSTLESYAVPTTDLSTQDPATPGPLTKSATFATPTALTLPALDKLCQNPYGCLREQLFPLGWSAAGRFAYLLERTNEAVRNYTLVAYILDTRTSTLVDSLRFRASEQPGYNEDAKAFDFDRVWELQEKAFRQLLENHEINSGSGITLQPLADLDLIISAENQSKTSMYTGKEVLSKHQLQLQTGGGSRTLYTHTYGKYELVLATELLGAFRSPDGQQHALLEAEEVRGFEGPPNVLKLRLIGF